MHNVGVCTTGDLALSVLTTVIGHQVDKGWAILDAGWMAMSRDRGTSKQGHDFGYGQPCELDGTLLTDYVLSAANQEHGILSPLHPSVAGESQAVAVDDAAAAAAANNVVTRFPIGTKLRILPNHACATGAQFPEYHALAATGDVAVWRRFHGW